MVKIIRSSNRLYRSPQIKSRAKKRSPVLDSIPIISDEKKQKEPDLYEHKWEMQFYELQKFKKKHGHCDVPFTLRNKKYHALARWCNTQRVKKKFERLKYSPDRLKKLNDLGFCWGILDKWYENKFRLLKQYHKKYGHCRVKESENKALARWCFKLREAYNKKAKTLTKERIARLTELGFEWYDIKKETNELLWEKQYTRLKAYKIKYGHCNLPRIHDNTNLLYDLANWVGRQRLAYRNKSKVLTKDKVKKLNSIGFNWVNPIKVGDARRADNQELLDELKRLYSIRNIAPSAPFIDKHGKYTSRVYYNHFGSMIEARKAAGIPLRAIFIKPNRYSDAELINELKRVAALLGKIPAQGEIAKHAKYSANLYFTRFGSISKARKAAGIDAPVVRKQISDEQALNELKRLATGLKRTPTTGDIVKYGKYSTKFYSDRFGSISQARKAAGL